MKSAVLSGSDGVHITEVLLYYHIAYTYLGVEKTIRLYLDGQFIDRYSNITFDSPIPRSDGDIPRLTLTLGSISSSKDALGKYRC